MPYIIDNITANTINVKDTLLINGVPVAGGGGIDDITYSELYNKTVNGELTPGKWYRLTDYKSVNFLNGWEIADNNPSPTDPNFNPQEIYSGETEVLILQATSPYEISEIGYSETFEGDVIQYQPFTNKIGVDIDFSNGYTLPDSSTVSGFDLQWDGTNVYFNMPTGYPALFGHYFYLYCEFSGGTYYQDGNYEPLTPGIATCQYPYTNDSNYLKPMSRLQVVDNGMKVILLDLTEQDYLNYDADTLYVDTVYALGEAYGWITKRQDTFRNITVPFDFRGRKYRRFEVDLSAVNSALGTQYYGQGDNFLNQGTTGNYKDFKIFGNDGYDVYNIEWNDMGGPDMYWYCGFNDNNVFARGFYMSKLNSYSRNNTVGNYFYFNTVGNDFKNNTVDATIGAQFGFNTLGNYFQNNKVGSFFNENKVDNFFNDNTVGNFFQYNTTKNQLNGFNFSSSTHVYGTYNCELFRASNNSNYLSYFDGTSMQYVSPTT